VFVMLLAITAIAAIFTWIVPAGQYDMVEGAGGRLVPDPQSFQFIERTPIGFFEMVRAVPRGMEEVGFIIFFILIIGGAFNVITSTGAIEAGLGRLAKAFAGKELLLIPIMMTAFAIFGATFGMAEETIPFVPILVTLALALKFDSITGTAIVFLGATAGFTSGILNPFTVGVAQGIAGLPLFSALGFRVAIFVVMVGVSIAFVMRYALKVKKNPQLSPMYEVDKKRDNLMDINNLPEFTPRRIIILLMLLATIVILIIGVMRLGWWIEELSVLFLVLGFVAALVGGIGPNGFGSKMTEGMSAIAGGALVVGFARAIVVVLNDGNILHTMLFAASNVLSNFVPLVSALGMYVFQSLLNYLIPSGSGQAAVSMPIMAPLADLVGVTRQTSVVAFHIADGIANAFMPMSAFLMAGLAIAKIQWNIWARWILPLIGLQYLLGAIFVIVAHMIRLGPY